MKKILFAASEAVPFIKTGGLADVVGTLPKYFNKEKYDVRVILPKYACMKDIFKEQLVYNTHFYMDFNSQRKYVGIMEMEYEGVKFYFIDNEEYFSGPKPYTDAAKDIEKFAYFAKAVVCTLPVIEFKPDVLHCHDWQTGLVPVFLDHFRFYNDYFSGIRTAITIHNLKFQGVWSIPGMKEITELPDYYFTSDKLEAYGDANMLKGGIVYANKVTTVSSTYAEEIKTPFYGERLEGLMKARSNSLLGIVNGIDYSDFSPENDKHIVQKYTVKNFKEEKVKNKIALQEELGLNQDAEKMMIGVVSRLTDQKGFDLVAHVFDELCQDDIQFVILGTGEEQYENLFRHYAWKYPEKVSANIYYSDAMSHKIYAACDAFLMPSLFEPCGLSQLMSLKYGTLPIVRETGGLKDTVDNYDGNKGTGFSFPNYNAHEMLDTLRRAESVYYDDKNSWNDIVERAMKADFSWISSARKYEEMYNNI